MLYHGSNSSARNGSARISLPSGNANREHCGKDCAAGQPISHAHGLETPCYFSGGLSQDGGQSLHTIEGNIFRGPGKTDCSHRSLFNIKNGSPNTPQSNLVFFVIECITQFSNSGELTF